MVQVHSSWSVNCKSSVNAMTICRWEMGDGSGYWHFSGFGGSYSGQLILSSMKPSTKSLVEVLRGDSKAGCTIHNLLEFT